MAFSGEIEFDDEEIRKFFNNFKKRLKAVDNGEKKFAALLSAIVYGDIMDHFKKEEGPQGKWPAWSKIYREHMDKIGQGGNNLLQFSGRLRQNFLPTSVRTTKDNIEWFNNAKTKKGFPYAAAHNEGGSKLPKRNFMWASDNAVERMAKNTLGFILDEGV